MSISFVRNSYFVCVLLLLAFSSVSAQPSWAPVSSPTSHTLRNLHFVDSLYGWAAGDSGAIVATTDGGLTWFAQNSGVETDIYDIHFPDRNYGWAVTWRLDTLPYGTMLLKTTNGGEEWIKEIWSEPDIFLLTVYFADSLNGWVSGYEGRIFRTFSGGIEWRPDGVVPGFCSSFPVLSMNMFNKNYGFVSGGHVDISGVIWKTTDSGDSWYSNCYSPEPLNAVYYLDSANIIAVGGDFEYGTGIIRSSDAGNTWHYSSLQMFGIATGIDFRKPGEAWLPLAYANSFIYTFDTCRTWNIYSFPQFTDFFDVCFLDSTKGFAVGTMGRIYKYIPETVGIRENEESGVLVNTNIRLRSYPNPFRNTAAAEITLPRDAVISLRLFSLQGEMIKEVYSGFMEKGSRAINIPADSLPAGIYIIELNSGSEQVRAKMVKIK